MHIPFQTNLTLMSLYNCTVPWTVSPKMCYNTEKQLNRSVKTSSVVAKYNYIHGVSLRSVCPITCMLMQFTFGWPDISKNATTTVGRV